MNTKSLIYGLWLFLMSMVGFGQSVQIEGRVLNVEDRSPVSNAALFVSGSQEYAISDSLGKFSFRHKIAISGAELVITHVAFHLKTLKINGENVFEILLTPKEVELSEVTIKSRKDRTWKKQFKKFEKAFIGTSDIAKKCEIENPWVVSFEETGGALTAKSDVPLKIRNEALGYNLLFVLGHFSLKNDLTSYSGKALFKSIDDSQVVKIKRQLAYEGSMRHFFHSLKENKLKENDFQVFDARQDALGDFIQGKRMKGEDLSIYNEETKQWQFVNNGFLKIVYTKEPVPTGYAQMTSQSVAMKTRIGQSPVVFDVDSRNQQTSYVFSQISRLTLREDGFPVKDKYLHSYGLWAWERVGDMMPLDYYLPDVLVQED